MIKRSVIKEQLKHTLDATNLSFLGPKYEGKVRDCYARGDRRYLITSDRLSCFDVVVTTVPFKGQVLNHLSVFWFEKTKDLIENHLVDVPDANVMVVKSCEILPIEVVVRGYLAGSAWRDYQNNRPISGVQLPPGLKAHQRLPQVLLTPSTKAAKGQHDKPISEAEILSSGIVETKLWLEVKEKALSLFAIGQKHAETQGLILVDTKYEFGIHRGKLILADEIHTLDSSRFWMRDSYNERFSKGEAPQMLDKEPMRQWLIAQGYMGDGPVPHFSDDYRIEIAEHYIGSAEKITGIQFQGDAGEVSTRIEQNLENYLKQGQS